MPEIGKKIAYKGNRSDLAAHFPTGSVRKNVEVDLTLLDHYDQLLTDLELYICRTAKIHDPHTFYLLRTIPGVGKILALVLLYEIHDINRFERVQDFCSYCRLVKATKTSNGKRTGSSGNKIDNAHLKWAFSEAACLFLRGNEPAQKALQRLQNKYGNAKALSRLAHKLGRTVYYMLKRRQAFDIKQFFR